MKGKGVSLVVGADGLIGRSLADYLMSGGESVVETTRRVEATSGRRVLLDLTKDVTKWRSPCEVSVAYLCAAVTSLQSCREVPAQSAVINVQHTVALAKTLVKNRIFVVFPSSNLVFDGSVPFQKADAKICPKTEYGKQKAEAERQLLAFGDWVAVVRLTMVLSPNMLFLADWVRRLRHNEVITPFSDMVMSPVSLNSVVDILSHVGKKRVAGIIQISGEKDVTYEQVARHIAQNTGADPALVQPIKSCKSGLNPEAVPLHTTLDISRLRNELGAELPDVWATVDSVLNLL